MAPRMADAPIEEVVHDRLQFNRYKVPFNCKNPKPDNRAVEQVIPQAIAPIILVGTSNMSAHSPHTTKPAPTPVTPVMCMPRSHGGYIIKEVKQLIPRRCQCRVGACKAAIETIAAETPKDSN
mmetsp:Transcript_7000/g.15401  ORF Transcript_7000/g.15401 Transcript_7000/m.15401 type:complete len:123 (-) Transcript_7000:960-1328(-)